MMIYVGVLGVILPGLPGAPFLIAGTAVLTPGGPQLLTRWAKRKPKGVVHTSLKHISRWLDDLERRYPRHQPVTTRPRREWTSPPRSIILSAEEEDVSGRCLWGRLQSGACR